MKKAILCLSIIALAVVSANAQVKFGLKAGLNLSSYTGKDAALFGGGKEGKLDFNGGGLVNIGLCKSFSLQPEIFFSGQGTRFAVGNSNGGGEFDVDYVNVPLLIKYNVTKGFALEAGPQVGFLISAIGKPYTTGESAINEKSYFNTMDYAVAFGASYLTNANLGFDARYNWGLSKDLLQGTNDPYRLFGTVFQLGAYYMFGK
jgi:outer membrane protein with beta-barrel domain